MFHPPYNYNKVETAVEKLGALPWVKKAFDSQKEHLKYSPMKGFIEENIVEALGIYVLLKLGVETEMYKDPHKYFQEHDEGSHVVSPRFYDYLVNKPKPAVQSFEDYFIAFVDELI